MALGTSYGTSRAVGDAAGILTDMPATGFSVLTFMLVIVSTATPGTAAYGSLLQTKQFTLNWNHAAPTFVCVASLYNGGAFPKVAWANQGSGFAPGTMAVIGGTYDGTTMRLYRSGAADNSAAMGNAGGYSPIALNILSCSGDTVSNGVQVNLVYWDTTRALSAPEMLSLTSNPWQVLEFQGVRLAGLSAAAGGTTYNDSTTESATLADALTATLTLPGSASESMLLADSLSATGIWLASQADSITAADVVSTALTLAATQSEAASLSDTVSATGVWLASRTEAAALADTVSNTAVLVASMSEAAALSEAMALGQLGNVTESLTLADSLTASLVLAAGVSEGATLADATAAVATLTAAGAEALTLADAVSATGGGGAVLSPDPRWIITFPRGGFDIEFPPHDWTIRS